MSSLVLSGDTSGTVALTVPAVAGSNTITFPAATATGSVNVLGTAVASTSGTSIDFTSIPSWVKRITVMFNGVSTSGTNSFLVQVGAGSITTSGYIAHCGAIQGASIASTTSTSGAVFSTGAATDFTYGPLIITNFGSNTWNFSGTIFRDSATDYSMMVTGTVTLSGTLDRIRITTVGGTDTFDAGSINILYE